MREVATDRCIEGGDERNVSDEVFEERWHMSDYMWLEGNWGCDCNRWLDFQRALGNDPDISDAKCAEDNAYVYEWIEVDGVRIVENDEATEHAT